MWGMVKDRKQKDSSRFLVVPFDNEIITFLEKYKEQHNSHL